jgi:hypothetical protein|nr:MAG TPA: hypothetical protein [Caudoviricetes sp.]
MRDVYIVYSCSGEWEDYIESIVYLVYHKHYAEILLKQLQEEDKRLEQEYRQVYKQLESFEDDDLGDLWLDRVEDIYFEDFLNEPEQYPNVLSQFTIPEQKRLLEYAQLYKRWEQLGGYMYDGTNYFIRQYAMSDDGRMTYINSNWG